MLKTTAFILFSIFIRFENWVADVFTVVVNWTASGFLHRIAIRDALILDRIQSETFDANTIVTTRFIDAFSGVATFVTNGQTFIDINAGVIVFVELVAGLRADALVTSGRI